jgi:phosphoglycolate phosphatase
LEHHGFEAKEASEITCHIGPPLDKTLPVLIQNGDKALIASMVDKYRERYLDTGFSENVVYDGMNEILYDLANNSDARIAVCTSKPAKTAKTILQMFGLLELFEFVSGGDVGIEKWQQLAELRADNIITEKSLMIGDRSVDLTAAHKNGLSSAGALWGYGSRAELEAEKPVYIFEQPKKLIHLA